jgi:hypothetical protein
MPKHLDTPIAESSVFAFPHGMRLLDLRVGGGRPYRGGGGGRGGYNNHHNYGHGGHVSTYASQMCWTKQKCS